MIFIISYPFLLILYLLNVNSKLSFAYAFVVVTPTFFSFTKKFLKRYQRLNKISVHSHLEINELMKKIQTTKKLLYKKIYLEQDCICIHTPASLLSVGEVIKIKKVNQIFFIESQFPYFMEYIIPDTGVHLKNVKIIKEIILN